MAARRPPPPPRRCGGRDPVDGTGGTDVTDGALAARAAGSGWRDSVVRYYSLAKPGVLYGNVLTAAAGFLFASPGRVDWFLFTAVCIGTSLVIASACVLNNVLDRDIDTVMERTRKRATVTGTVQAGRAVAYSVLLGVAGVAVLAAWTNPLVVAVGLGGYLAYVVLYGMLSKRKSVHGTLVGSISGAAPILGGYLGARGAFDAGAAIAFLMLFLWQLPAFYSISIYRQGEYAKAGVPVISVVRGPARAKVQILLYTIAFTVVALLPQVFGLAGWGYTAGMGLLCLGWIGLGWIGLGVRGQAGDAEAAWARRMFRYALVVLMSLSIMMALGPRLP